ncbi:MAG: adenylyltransferase/cytidyltransferase family protein [Promethearchaeota archaeon]
MTIRDFPFELGVVHGRFQILHNDHLKFIMAAKKLSRHLIIGITNPDPKLTKPTNTNPHRDKPIANPLTYYERFVMIRETLIENGLNLEEFSIVPFPINLPELIKYYVPKEAVFFITIYDDWGKTKKKYLESLDLKVHILWEVSIEKKGLSSSDIRKAMITDNQWEIFVPKAVANLVKKWNIIERLKNLAKEVKE